MHTSLYKHTIFRYYCYYNTLYRYFRYTISNTTCISTSIIGVDVVNRKDPRSEALRFTVAVLVWVMMKMSIVDRPIYYIKLASTYYDAF